MSLVCPVGPEQNLLDATPDHASRLFLPHPVLSLEEMAALKTAQYRGWKATTLDASFSKADADASPHALRDALARLCAEAEEAVQQGGAPLLVLSNRASGPERLPIPSLLATGAVHQHLIKKQARTSTGLLIESGDAVEPHDFCTMVGYGADGICPYGAYAAVAAFHGDMGAREADLMEKYRYSAGKAMLKVMSKIGISTVQAGPPARSHSLPAARTRLARGVYPQRVVHPRTRKHPRPVPSSHAPRRCAHAPRARRRQSYKGAQIFEAVGLGSEIMDTCFTGTASRLACIGF